MKHLPEKSVKKLAKSMLYFNKAVYLDDDDDDDDDDDVDRSFHSSATAAERTDLNLTEQIKLFKDYI